MMARLNQDASNTVMMETESFPEKSENLHILKQLSARKKIIKLILCLRRPKRAKTANNRPTTKGSA